MQAFKLAMRIINKNKAQMLIYVVIFFAISAIMSSYSSRESKSYTSFTPAKTTIAFISEEDTPLIDGFKKELARVADFANIPDETEALQDALYFRQVSCVLRIPKGFTEKFMNGENVQIERMSIPNSMRNVHVELCIDKYFNTAALYVRSIDGISQQELVRYLEKDLSETASVEIAAADTESPGMIDTNYFFNYFAYPLLSAIILGMSALMLVLNDPDLKMRNNCAPVKSTSISMQFILAGLVFTVLSWLLIVILHFAVNFRDGFGPKTLLLLASSFIFAICCLSISFLAGTLVKSRDAIHAAANVLSLGMSFISGVFVPQELLGSHVLKIASFTPVYWYVRANNTIAGLNAFTPDTLKPVINDFLIIIGFGTAFFSVSLALRKQKTS